MKAPPPTYEISATREEGRGLGVSNESGAPAQTATADFVRRLEHLASSDLAIVGGKNASLGELLQHLGKAGVRVPPGFATTAHAYRRFLEVNAIDGQIRRRLDALEAGRASLAETGRAIRGLIAGGRWPVDVAVAIRRAYRELALESGVAAVPVAVRSSATAEDLPEASFAGQLESFLNVRGEDAVLDACHRCFASLFTDRAIAYRREHGLHHLDLALSVGVQRMVRSDRGCAGVLFTLDTDTGFPDVVLIDGAWGLGESVVQGTVDPDQYVVFKPFLEDHRLVPIIGKRLGAKRTKVVYGTEASGTRTVDTGTGEQAAFTLEDGEILTLSRWAVAIEKHYGRPMDVEWAKDGETGDIFIVQARPETVQSRRDATSCTGGVCRCAASACCAWSTSSTT